MTIGIDARMYGGKQTGIGNYIRHLTRYLFQIDQENQYLLFLLEPEFSHYQPPTPRITKIKVNAHWYTWKEQLFLPWQLKKFPLDLIHFPHFNAPILYNQRYILTIHDLTQRYFPGSSFSSFFRKQAYTLAFAHNIKKAAAIICVSHYTKKNVLENFKVDRRKIKVIYEGIEEGFRPLPRQNKIKALKDKYKIDKPFILYVGVVREHKNIVGLVKAFNLLLKKYKLDIKLVIVGSKDPRYTKTQEIINKLKLKRRIIQTGFVPQKELLLFYNAASLFVLPSYREGFGLTPLEAMACNTPVVVTQETSPPEILDDAALYFNPYDVKNMARIIAQVLQNQNLRQELVKKGKEQIKKFSWPKCARETLKLYSQISPPS